ncbi:kynureninase [Phakopsora pachyrhizi]|uniref:Kynureninase n=1 Tax=Phakopsora pachyrhizi TaxID=170000 RepID=A0AAV0ACV8_PHAPC|nr:kynureninase [Phakopsora pachyrhizi]
MSSTTTPTSQRTIWARRLSASACLSLTDPKFSNYLDNIACPGGIRYEFRFPSRSNKSIGSINSSSERTEASTESDDLDLRTESEDSSPCVYLCGNSLGLQNKKTAELILEELNVWAERAVNGHFDHPYGRNWKDICDLVNPTLAYLVGASSPDEVACTGSLTTNLHLMMTTFYRPTKQRYKILFEKKCFPSDMYAFTSQAELHGLDPKDALLMMSPRPGEYTLRTEDILSTIHREGESIALIIFPGVQFYTGQVFPMKQITTVGHQYGCVVGFDLAHAVGNIVLELNSWKVDFACWCSYKYLNAGPGAIAGIFLHEDWFNDPTKIGGPNGRPRLAGWFGHNADTRFKMPEEFEPIQGAGQFVHSNPDIFSVVSLLSSLQLFASYPGGMVSLRSRSEELTSYLEICLNSSKFYIDLNSISKDEVESDDYSKTGDQVKEKVESQEVVQNIEKSKLMFTIITPTTISERGSQLSLLFLPKGKQILKRVFNDLVEIHGVIGDEREPDVLRLSPVALYNSFEDCRKACEALDSVLSSITL